MCFYLYIMMILSKYLLYLLIITKKNDLIYLNGEFKILDWKNFNNLKKNYNLIIIIIQLRLNYNEK